MWARRSDSSSPEFDRDKSGQSTFTSAKVIFLPDGWRDKRPKTINMNRWICKTQVLLKYKMLFKKQTNKLQNRKNLQALIFGGPNGHIPRMELKSLSSSPQDVYQVKKCWHWLFWLTGNLPSYLLSITNRPPICSQDRSQPKGRRASEGLTSPWKH